MAVKKGETALQKQLDDILAGMRKDGSLNALALKWLKPAAAHRLPGSLAGKGDGV